MNHASPDYITRSRTHDATPVANPRARKPPPAGMVAYPRGEAGVRVPYDFTDDAGQEWIVSPVSVASYRWKAVPAARNPARGMGVTFMGRSLASIADDINARVQRLAHSRANLAAGMPW